MSEQLDQQQNSRRKFITRLGQVVGVTAACALTTGANLSTAFAYQIRPDSEKSAGKVFSQSQMMTLRHIAGVILPKTDTPSGAELDCHGFLDNQLAVCHSEQQQTNAKAIIDVIETHAMTVFSKSYHQLNPQQQTVILRDVEAMKGFDEDQKYQFKFVKSLIVFGYFTTEVGIKQALRYDPVPGGFRVIPYKPGDKAWGVHAFY
jgi:hypothetical protein